MSFIDDIKGKAIEIYKKYGILPSITIAQASLESGNGTSGLTTKANNLFGIKGTGTAGSITLPTSEYYDGKMQKVPGTFRAYNSWNESLDDYAKLLSGADRYNKVVSATNYKDASYALGKSGYATDPNYASKIMNIIEKNKLYQLDIEVTGKDFNPSKYTVKEVSSVQNPSNYRNAPKALPTDPVTPQQDDEKIFNTNLLSSIGEWLSAGAFVLVGLTIMTVGILFLFGGPSTIIKEVITK